MNCTPSFCNAVKQICNSDKYDMESSCNTFLRNCPTTGGSPMSGDPCCNTPQADKIIEACKNQDYDSAKSSACPLWFDCDNK